MTHSKHAGKRAWIFLCCLLACLGWHYFVQMWLLSHSALSFCRTMLDTVDMPVFLPYGKHLDIAVGTFFVTEAACYSPSGNVLFGHDNLLCQWTCRTLPVVLCHSEWNVKCLSVFNSFILSFHLSFQHASALETVSHTAESSPFAISSSWCGYCYRCYFKLWVFYFQGPGSPYPVVEPHQVLCKRFTCLARTPGCCTNDM